MCRSGDQQQSQRGTLSPLPTTRARARGMALGPRLQMRVWALGLVLALVLALPKGGESRASRRGTGRGDDNNCNSNGARVQAAALRAAAPSRVRRSRCTACRSLNGAMHRLRQAPRRRRTARPPSPPPSRHVESHTRNCGGVGVCLPPHSLLHTPCGRHASPASVAHRRSGMLPSCRSCTSLCGLGLPKHTPLSPLPSFQTPILRIPCCNHPTNCSFANKPPVHVQRAVRAWKSPHCRWTMCLPGRLSP